MNKPVFSKEHHFPEEKKKKSDKRFKVRHTWLINFKDTQNSSDTQAEVVSQLCISEVLEG